MRRPVPVFLTVTLNAFDELTLTEPNIRFGFVVGVNERKPVATLRPVPLNAMDAELLPALFCGNESAAV